MNTKSLIVQIIADNPDCWEEIMTQKLISVKKYDTLALFMYGLKAYFPDPVVQEARGIIIDTETLEVVCWPFNKFFNIEESSAAVIDWDSAKVYNKYDGSLVKLWYYKKEHRWVWSSNGEIFAENCKTGSSNGVIKMLNHVIEIALCDNDIVYDALDKENTYMFELLSPYNRILIDYGDKPMLKLIGVKNNLTGEETIMDVPGVKEPYTFPSDFKIAFSEGIDEVINNVNILNIDDDGKITDIKYEGYVVCDKYFNRVKIKSPIYIMFHQLDSLSLGRHTKNIIKKIMDGTIDSKSIEEKGLPYAHIVKYYEFKLSELYYKLRQYIKYARSWYIEMGYDRKALAMKVGSSKYKSVAFAAVNDMDIPVDEVISKLRSNYLISLIPAYEREEIYKEFY